MRLQALFFQRWLRTSIFVAVAAIGVVGAVILGTGNGNPSNTVRLLSGSAWLSSAKVGQLTLLDGTSAEVAAQVQVSSAGNAIDAVQHGSTGYAIDRTTGTIRRVDGATFELTTAETPIPDASGGLTAFATDKALYTVDTQRGVLATVDPKTLVRQGELVSVAADLQSGSAVLDDGDRLWFIDASTGDLTWIDGQRRSANSRVTAPGRSIVTITDGQPVVINTEARTATTIDSGTGKALTTFDIDLRQDDTVLVAGSPHHRRVYLVASRGVLSICELAASRCDNPVPLSQGSTFGFPVEAGNRVFVPDYTTGQVWIVDLTDRSVIAKPHVLDPQVRFQLLAKDGVVFFNDPNTERAGVIRLNGDINRTAKYDPKAPTKHDNQPPTPAPEPPTPAPPNPPTPSPEPPSPNPPPQPDPPQPAPPSPQPNPPPTTTQNPPPPSPAPDTPPPKPVLKITVTKTNPAVNEDITLQVGTESGDLPKTARWDFGDGSQGNGNDVTHHWTAAKTYQVSVQVTMPDNQQATTSLSLTVTPIPTVKLLIVLHGGSRVTGPGFACPPTCERTVNQGQSITITAAPIANHRFLNWATDCGGTAPTCTLAMDRNKEVNAIFEAAIMPFVGNWHNIDTGSGGIAQAQLTNTSATTATLHAWGKCTPTNCDWGNTQATLRGNELHAFYDQGFVTRTLRITVTGDRLTINWHSDFVDPNRPDYDAVDVFTRR